MVNEVVKYGKKGEKMKKILYLFMSLLVLLSFTACGGSSSKDEDAKIKIWIPGDRSEYSFYYDMFDKYKEKLESEGKEFDFVIEQQPWGDYWTKLPLEVNKGRGPDLFLTHVAYIDVVSAISKELDLDKKVLDTFTISDLYLGKNGKPLFIPTVFVSNLMYVNTDMWQAEFGKGNRDYPKSWKELETASLRLKKQGTIGFNYSYHILWDIGYQNGKLLTTEEGKINLSEIGLKTIEGWEKEGVSSYLAHGNGNSERSLLEGSAAIIYGEPWIEGWARSSSDINFEAFPVPGKKGDILTHSSAELSFGINKNASGERYKKLLGFVKFMITDKETMESIARGSAGVSNNKELAKEMKYKDGSAGKVVTDQFLSGQTVISIPSSGLEDLYKNMIGNFLSQNVSAKDEIEATKKASTRLKLSRLKEMEDKFRGKVKNQ